MQEPECSKDSRLQCCPALHPELEDRFAITSFGGSRPSQVIARTKAKSGDYTGHLNFFGLNMDILFGALLGLLGGWLGTFLVHRLPLLMLHSWRQGSQEELELPVDPDLPELSAWGSHCTSCRAPVPFLHSLPLVGFVLARGRCSCCKARISLRNPLLELGGAAIGALAIAAYGWTLVGLAMAVVGALLLWSAFIDMQHKLLPNILLYPIAAIGLYLSTQYQFIPPNTAIFGALAGYGILAVPAALCLWIFKIEGIGDSDPRLLMAVGTFVGPIGALTSLLAATLVAGVGILGMALVRKGEINREIPFGQCLALGGLIVFIAQSLGLPGLLTLLA